MHHWVVFGAGNFLADILDAIQSSGGYVSEIVLNQEIDPKILNCCSKLVKVTSLDSYKPDPSARHIFGFLDPNKKPFLERLKKYKTIKFYNLHHDKAYVTNSTKLGIGNYFGPGCVVGPEVVIGDFNYLNRCSSVGHNTTIGSFNHIGPGATICGLCDIGERNYIGAASCIRDGVVLTEDVVLGMGAVAVNSLVAAGTYVGIPAKLKLKVKS